MPHLLLLAKLDPERKRSFGAIAAATHLELSVFERAEAALAWLEGHDPRVVVFDANVAQTDKVCHKVRSKKKLAAVPLIAQSTDDSDAFVERLYSQGADDVITASSSAPLLPRLRALPPEQASTLPPGGLAVVADKDHGRCDLFGRVLMNAGYDVKFALDDVALRYYTQQNKPRLVVGNVELGAPRKIIEEARQKGTEAVWIVTAPRRELVKYAEALAGLELVTVVATSTSPENILFTSNELLRGPALANRADERALYGTVVRFRPAGSDADDAGFSYNLSLGGLYVRTLAPIESERVWLELRPPRCRQQVRLEGRVAWKRSYDPSSAAPAPPGFGVALSDGLGDGLELWKRHTEAFVRSTRRGPTAVARLVSDALDDARTSGEFAGAELPSDSHISMVPVLSQLAPKPAPAPPPLPSEARPKSVPPPLPPPLPAVVPPPPAAAPALSVEPALPPAVAAGPDGPLATVLPPSSVREPVPEPAIAPAQLPAPKRSRAPLLLALVALVVLLGAAAFVLFGGQNGPHIGAQPAPSQTPRASSVPVATPVLSATSSAPAAPAVAAPNADAAVAADAAATTDAATSDELPPLDEAGAGDGSELGPSYGYLAVRSRASADVWASGVDLGPTNKKNKAACGLRFVRLGKGSPPSWLDPGRTIDVKCKASTLVEIEP